MEKIINNILIKTTGYRLTSNKNYITSKKPFLKLKDEPHIDKKFLEICSSLEKIYNKELVEETNYTAYLITKNIITQNIKGCIVECGVHRGQKISIFIETLKLLNVYDRDIYIIDTYEGMTEPSKNDYQVITNKKLKQGDLNCSLEEVKSNITKSGYPNDKLHFIKMDVRDEKNLKNNIIDDIALLRCDTDLYDSTLSTLEALYYKVIKNGYIIHDDYGHWKGHYDACHEFYTKNNIKPCFIRTCRKEMVEVKSA